MYDLKVTDLATPALQRAQAFMGTKAAARFVGRAALGMTRARLAGLSPNKNGWPSTGFYQATAARGTSMTISGGDVRINIDHPNHPGAIKHQYNQGNEGKVYVEAGDKLLTIPARPEFYGHRAGEFVNLRFVKFRSGAMALVIGLGGAARIGKLGGTDTRGIGARAAMMVAYWLKDRVEQDAKPEILPTADEYREAMRMAAADAWDQLVKMARGREGLS